MIYYYICTEDLEDILYVLSPSRIIAEASVLVVKFDRASHWDMELSVFVLASITEEM